MRDLPILHQWHQPARSEAFQQTIEWLDSLYQADVKTVDVQMVVLMMWHFEKYALEELRKEPWIEHKS